MRRFKPDSLDFLAQVPADQLRSVFQQIADGYAPITFTGFAADPTETQIVANIATKSGEPWVIFISVQGSGEHLIEGLLFQPADQEPVKLKDFNDLATSWAAFASSATFLIA